MHKMPALSSKELVKLLEIASVSSNNCNLRQPKSSSCYPANDAAYLFAATFRTRASTRL